MNFNNKLLNDIEDYCKLNELDADEFVNDLLKRAFMVEKYGEKPPFIEKPNKKKIFDEDKELEEAINNMSDEELIKTIAESSVANGSEQDNDSVEEVKTTEIDDEFKVVEKVKRSKKRKLSQ